MRTLGLKSNSAGKRVYQTRIETVKMESGSLELEILGLQIIKFAPVERAKTNSSDLLNILTQACCKY